MIKATEKIQKQSYYLTNPKDEITVFYAAVTEKEMVDLQVDLPKINVKNLYDFFATYYNLIIHFSDKYFLKLSEPSSKLVII